MSEKISLKGVLFNPLSKNNPVVVQILGICSVLAVTAKPVSYTHLECNL